MLMDNSITLQHNPYKNFAKSATPVGLYARQKWLGQEKDRSWQTDFNNTVKSLLEGQLKDGSWNGSFIHTTHRLFGLHLTVRYPTDAINKALDWLFINQAIGTDEHKYPAIIDLKGLPFAPGNLHYIHKGMTLFLATIFGRENNPDVISLYQRLSQQVLETKEIRDSYGDINNILRALVVHVIYARSAATENIIIDLSKIQKDSGLWEGPLPFYQTVNALAHLDLPEADKQLDKAFNFLVRTQNEDGTWGNTEQEWNTFLVVHAMRNKKVLK